MNILMIAPEPFFEPRGTPLSIYGRLKALSELGHTIDLVTYHIGQDIHLPGVHIYRNYPIRFIKSINIGPSFHKFILDIFIFGKALSLLSNHKNKYLVIHAHEEAGYFGIYLSRIFRIKHIYDMHSRLPVQLRNSKYGKCRLLTWLFEVFERKTLHMSDAIITIGDDLETYVKKVTPQVYSIKIENLPLYSNFNLSDTCDIEDIRNRHKVRGKRVVVYTGTFEAYQGLELLIDSAKIVNQHNKDILFILVGGTKEQIQDLQNKVNKRGLNSCFIFTGTVNPMEAIRYLEIADILISPRLEGMSTPLKIYTYLYSGKPIVATDIPAHHLPGEEKIHLVEPSAEGIANGLIELSKFNFCVDQTSEISHRTERLKAISTDYSSRLEKIYLNISSILLANLKQPGARV